LPNQLAHRLHDGNHTVALHTARSRGQSKKTTCTATVVEELHCVVMPDSLTKCPPFAHQQ
jgi:hypothetical protein